MGLDMYLHRKRYVKNWDYMKPEQKTIVTVERGGVVLDMPDISYIIQEVAYWRKTNAIHQWFVDNCAEGVDDCKEVYVSREKLRELLEIIQKILANRSFAPALLPTQEGFFFGSTDYGDYYYEDLEYTKKVLVDILKDDEGEFYYRASW